MQKKVTIIGAGAVGATTAFTLLARGAASDVVLIDINSERAQGEAMDIKQATPFIDNCDIIAGTYEDAVGSDVVIITSGIGRKPGQSRLELVQTNIGIIKQIANDIVKAYALTERAFMYDWCLCSGEYSLSDYASPLLSAFLSHFSEDFVKD